jgi:hypothetical protein
MAKTKKPAKNLGGRPRKAPAERARRIAVYLPGPEFRALLERARELNMRPRRAPNEGRGRTQSEVEDAVVAAYARERLIQLADRIVKA